MAIVPKEMLPRWCEKCGAMRGVEICTEYYDRYRYREVLCGTCLTRLEEYGEQEGEY